MIMRLQFLIAMCLFGSSSQFMSVKKQVRGFCESRLGGELCLWVMRLRPYQKIHGPMYIYIHIHSPDVLLGPSGPLSMSSCHQGLLCQSLPSQGIEKIPQPETTCTLESIEYWRFGYTGVSSDRFGQPKVRYLRCFLHSIPSATVVGRRQQKPTAPIFFPAHAFSTSSMRLPTSTKTLSMIKMCIQIC